MLVRFEDFKGEARIPDLYAQVGVNVEVNLATQAEVTEYCEKYEPEFVDMFFGEHTCIKEDVFEYSFLPTSQQTDVNMNALLSALRSMIAHFVAFYFFRYHSVINSGVGAVIMQPQHAERTDIVNKCVVVWNDMVKDARKWHVKLFGYEYPKDEIFHKINFLNM